jgi:hypothetical protein
MDKMTAALKKVDWPSHLEAAKVFPRRFATGDFSLIQPLPHESAAVAGLAPRVAAHTVWRRALLVMACVLSFVVFIKHCFEPRTMEASVEENLITELKKAQPDAAKADIEKAAREQAAEQLKIIGSSNVSVIDGLMAAQLLVILASAVLQFMAARQWKERLLSQRLAMWALAVPMLFQIVIMLIPWSSLMDFSHIGPQLEARGLDGAAGASQIKLGMQTAMTTAVITSALPFFYSLFNGVLRSTLATKTLIPASIVCGWASILLAATIAVPWFFILSVVDQTRPDALIFLCVVCLLAAPLSSVFKGRRLGSPLSPSDATPVVKQSKLLFSLLNLAGVAMLVTYLLDKKVVKFTELIAPALSYFANLMLISVVSVDLLVRILERAHRKLAADEAPEEPLRQIGEAMPVKPGNTPA